MKLHTTPNAEKDERGMAAVFTAVLSIVLLAATGLGVDTGNLALQRSQAQHGADAAALAVATDCAMGRSDCSPQANQPTAEYFVDKNAPGAEVTEPVVPNAGGTITVTAKETVPTTLMSVVGAESTDVNATAVASWGGHPVKGAPPLPLAVPYCQWLENKPGTSTTPTLLRTDVVGKVMDTTNTLPLLNQILSTLLPSLFNVTASCKAPNGQDIAQMRGPVWMTGLMPAVQQVLSGLLNFNPATCETYIDDVNVAVGGILSSAVPPSCISKLGTSIKAGQIIMLPVYMPANNLLNLGLNVQACTILLLTTSCVSVPPKLGVDIIGYAPFKITGWNFPGNVHTDPSAPICSPLITLLSLVSVGCNGITGRFVETVQKDPNFTYAASGADFGANRVELVQ